MKLSSENLVNILLKRGFQGKIYRRAREIHGNIMIVEGVKDAAYDEVVRIIGSDDKLRYGRVLEA
ncbi:MAG: hypothetical protein DRJ38_09040, partial [Thermoprotei archaeon]